MTPPHVVAVAVATLWTSPQSPRPIDLPALAAPSRVAEWADMLDLADRLDLHGRIETQALLGDPVVVDDEQDGWSRVVLSTQPSSKDSRGYPGWLPTAQLTLAKRSSPGAATVRVPTTALYDSPAGAVIIDDVSFATVLALTGPAEDGWLPLYVPDRPAVCWVAESDVDTEGAALPSRQDLLAAGRQFVGLPYLWGGTCGQGLDCSGLVHLVFRRFGLTVPRDAHDQAAAAPVSVDPGNAAPGDLLFFAKPGSDIHHVGIATGAGLMLHAPESGRGVTEEALSPERRSQLVAAGRWI